MSLPPGPINHLKIFGSLLPPFPPVPWLGVSSLAFNVIFLAEELAVEDFSGEPLFDLFIPPPSRVLRFDKIWFEFVVSILQESKNLFKRVLH